MEKRPKPAPGRLDPVDRTAADFPAEERELATGPEPPDLVGEHPVVLKEGAAASLRGKRIEEGHPRHPFVAGPGRRKRLGHPPPQLPSAGGRDPVEIPAGPAAGSENPEEDEPGPPESCERRVDLRDFRPPDRSDLLLESPRQVVTGVRSIREKSQEDVRERHAKTISIQI